jgi:hypothetical protein
MILPMNAKSRAAGEATPRVHARARTRLGLAALRDLTPEDIEDVLAYWYTSSEEYLDHLGIDRVRLGGREDTRRRMLRSIPTGDPDQQGLALAITLDGVFAGYTLLNRYTPELNYSHWHITDPRLRASGLSTALYPYRIKAYFDAVPIRRLVHQTRTRNIGVNRMLDRYVPVAETRYIEHPDGVALPGEFHLRYVFREDVPTFFEKLRPHTRS